MDRIKEKLISAWWILSFILILSCGDDSTFWAFGFVAVNFIASSIVVVRNGLDK